MRNGTTKYLKHNNSNPPGGDTPGESENNMTKKDLERRNKFLLLQIKIIKELISDIDTTMEEEKLYKRLGAADWHTSPENIKQCIKYIEKNDWEYNFYNDTMDIKEYE